MSSIDLYENSFKSPLVKELYKGQRGAHHPTCNRYYNHLIKLPLTNNLLCIGCTFMSLGFITFLSLFFFNIFNQFNFFQFWVLGVIAYSSAFIQMKIKPKKRLKMLLRYILGLGTGSLLISIYIIPWDTIGIILKVIGLFIFAYVADRTFKLRGRNLDDQCISCPYGTFPFCNHKLPKMKLIYQNNSNKELNGRERIFIDLIGSFIEQTENPENKTILFEKDYCELNN